MINIETVFLTVPTMIFLTLCPVAWWIYGAAISLVVLAGIGVNDSPVMVFMSVCWPGSVCYVLYVLLSNLDTTGCDWWVG